MPRQANRRAAVYRFFAAEGALLYVGCSYNPFQRWQMHLCTKPWIEEVDDMKVTWFATHRDAARAEAEAIRDEAPRYNRQLPVGPLTQKAVVGAGPDLLKDWLNAGNGHWDFIFATSLNGVKLTGLRTGQRPPDADLAWRIERATDGAVPATSWAVRQGSEARPLRATDPKHSLRLREAHLRRKNYTEEQIAGHMRWHERSILG